MRERRGKKKKRRNQHSKCVLTVRNFETSMDFHLAFTVAMCGWIESAVLMRGTERVGGLSQGYITINHCKVI